MNMYQNRQRGSLLGAIIGAVAGIAIIAATGGIAGIHFAAGYYMVGAGIGGIAGGLINNGSSSSGSGSGAASSTEAAAGEEPPPVECKTVEEDLSALQAAYTDAQNAVKQAQENLAKASQNATSTSNNYDNKFNMCFDGSGGVNQYPCGEKNTGGCTNEQNQCNTLAAQVNATNQAACQIQTQALQLLPGGTASTTANPSANTFTIGLTPSTISVGGTISLVTTISISNVAANVIKTFTINVLDQNKNVLGSLANNYAITVAAKQVTLQYNFQMSSSLMPGTYTIRIFNDAKTTEFADATLTITGASSASGFSQNGSSTSGFTISLSPTTIYQGSPFTVNATVTSGDIKSYSIGAFQSDFSLGTLASAVPITSTSRPATVQQTFKTSATIPPGVYSVRIYNDANSSQYQASNLTVLAGTGSSAGTGFVATGGTGATTGVSGGVGVTGSYYGGTSGGANVCSLPISLQLGNKDATTGGQVSALQNFLTAGGYYHYQVTGYFGAITKTAVKAFQSANGVPSTGFVGTLTRAAIKASQLCFGH